MCGGYVELTTLSRQCGILNISQPYRTPRPVTGIALPFYFFLYFTLLPETIQNVDFHLLIFKKIITNDFIIIFELL
jgi:hypothetical protein